VANDIEWESGSSGLATLHMSVFFWAQPIVNNDFLFF
jgi:hypothetical protein